MLKIIISFILGTTFGLGIICCFVAEGREDEGIKVKYCVLHIFYTRMVADTRSSAQQTAQLYAQINNPKNLVLGLLIRTYTIKGFKRDNSDFVKH